jgi:hypothetical protein
MLGHTVARFVATLVLLTASVAWVGWIYLHTVADPGRSDRIAHAILTDPQARHEVATDIANGLATATNKVLAKHGQPAVADGADPALQSAVDAALTDPRITANLVDAIAAEHAIALGVTPAHAATLDTGPLVTAVRAHLLPVEPGIARAIPAVGTADIHLPTAHVPYARQLRTWAKRWTGVLALAACAGLLVALLIGDRAGVLRRAGFWALGAALAWALLPLLVTWAGDRATRSQAAVIRAVLRGAAGPVTAAAAVLAVAGAAAVAVSYLAPEVLGSLGGVRRRPGALEPAPADATTPPFTASPVGAAPPAMAAAAPPGAWFPSRRGSPSTDAWNPHDPTAPPPPVVYDQHGRFGDRTVRRPGVSRGSVGLDVTPDGAGGTEAAPGDPGPPS